MDACVFDVWAQAHTSDESWPSIGYDPWAEGGKVQNWERRGGQSEICLLEVAVSR